MGLKFIASAKPTIEEWAALAKPLMNAGRSFGFIIGDWLNYGEKAYGKKYAEVVEKTGMDYQTLRDWKWVAGAVELSCRQDNLSFEHHKAVAGLEPPEQKKWLNLCREEMEKGQYVGKRQLAKSITAGRLLTDSECSTPQGSAAIPNFHPLINRIISLWRTMKDKQWLENATEGQREGLKADLKPVLEIYEAL